jgi:hypothetical protein
MQLDLFGGFVPSFVSDAIEWASYSNGELILLINGGYGVGEWLRQNLELKSFAMQPDGKIAIRAIAPQWVSEFKNKKWQGGSGSSHPLNDLAW